MTGFQIFEAIGGLILGYVGVRFIVARRIPIVSEGGFEPLAWITGWEAVIVGCLIVCLGIALLAASFGLVALP
jgi:hypothetical protein